MKRITFLLISLFTAALLVGALSFNSGPTINSGDNATTVDDLGCEWNPSGDTTQSNVTWYKDGSLFLNESGVTSPHTIGDGNTSRGQIWNCTITISNGTATLNDSDTITIVNAPPNPIQVFNESGADIQNETTIKEDDSRTFNVSTTDPDGDEVTYGFNSPPGLPDNSNLDFDTGIFTWTADASQVGDHNVTFTAEDNHTNSKLTSKRVTFTVQEVNDKPTFSPALQDQTATEGQPFTYNISVADEEDDTPINFSISSDIDDLIINRTGNTTADITFADGSPGFEDEGNHTVTVTINDSRGGNNTGQFNLEVTTVNEAPNLSQVPNASGTQGQPFEVVVNATDREIDDTLTFSIAAVSCSVTNPWSITKLTEDNSGNETFANATINESSLTNDHIVCDEVNISVSDGKEIDWQVVTFNLTNVNDAPILHQNSTDSSNTDRDNITNQTAFANAVYRYQVNASDVDSLTSEGENLSYSDNTSLFNINSSTGLIEFTPDTSDIGNYTINITVSDDGGLSDSETMSMTVKNNTAPVIQDPGNITCNEDQLCTEFINATDADGDNITFSSNNTQVFSLTKFNSTTAVLNTTYNQSFVGNYTINVTATDIRGATDSVTFRFTVNNTNDDPVLDPINFPEPIVETHAVRVDVTADDEDASLPNKIENLTYNQTFLTGPAIFDINTTFDNSTNESTGIIQFTPNTDEDGEYSVNITVRDPEGGIDSQVVNFTVLNDTLPPNITKIRPYGEPLSNSTVFAFRNTSDFNGTNTTINVSENSSVFFNHTTTDDTTAQENLTFTWKLDGSNVSNNRTLNQSFDFFSSGTHNVTLVVEDDRLESSNWTWFVDVANDNRIPILHTPLENVTIESTETFNDYLYLRDELRYLDPDDDVNGDLRINSNETNLLSFTHTTCSVADITIEGTDVEFKPAEVGTCLMTFTAEDPEGASVESNTVEVNVTDVPNGTTTTTTVTTSSGGGGGGGGSSSVIPVTEEVESPEPLNIITPGEVTIYRNESITVPILLENTWNDSINNITLSAEVHNFTDGEISFGQRRFDQIAQGERKRTTMSVTGYRLGESFEVVVNASVEEPEFTDSALILFNAIEEKLRGEDVEIKVTFARDLLTKNEECQELGELLNEARRAQSQGDVIRANNLVETVINGCRYMMSQTQVNREEPRQINLDFLQRFNFFYIGAGILLLSLIAAIIFIETRIRKEEEKEQ